MNSNFLHTLISAVLSVLVLFSTLSLTIEKHFCGDKLIDAALFSVTKKCKGHVAKTNEDNSIKSNCCKDEIEFIEGVSESIIKGFDDFESINPEMHLTHFNIKAKFFETVFIQAPPNQFYQPPNFVKDIQLLDEVFLI